jgi:hypothetical protein
MADGTYSSGKGFDSYTDQFGNKFEFGVDTTDHNVVPSVTETIFFILLGACAYISLYMLMVTTTNGAVAGALGNIFLVANWSVLVALIVYVGTLIWSAIQSVVNNV